MRKFRRWSSCSRGTATKGRTSSFSASPSTIPVEKLKPYASQMKMNYPVLVGNGRDDVQDAFGPLWGIPVTVFIGRDGRIAKKHSGIASKEQFEQEIKALL